MIVRSLVELHGGTVSVRSAGKQVRESGDHSGAFLPAIALTAYVGKADRQRILAAGYQTHIAKPVALQELLQVVARYARPA